MELHNLRPATGSVRTNKRKGRGEGSGMGGTSTRGHKGAKSRSGYSSKRHFEGGQMPLQMRLPKRGFKNPNRVESVPMNLSRLQEIAEKYDVTTIGFDTLVELGIVDKKDRVKILAGGELLTPLNLSAHACSEAAKTAIEAAGGTLTLV
jgi:large subunit ribosomal protein L15